MKTVRTRLAAIEAAAALPVIMSPLNTGAWLDRAEAAFLAALGVDPSPATIAAAEGVYVAALYAAAPEVSRDAS